MSTIHGCEIQSIPTSEADALLAWAITGVPDAAPAADGLEWLLCYCWDGVCWGRCEGSSWVLASQAFPELVPAPSREKLIELRVFGPKREALLWVSEDHLTGRWVADSAVQPQDEWLRPRRLAYITHGDENLGQKSGFTHVRDRAGMQQVLPLVLETTQLQRSRPRIEFTEYLASDDQTGLLRPAASRLAGLTLPKEES